VPTALNQTTPVSKKATPGKTLVDLVCGVPVCTEFANGMEEAAKHLGWKLVRVDLGLSPEQFAAAYDRAIQLKPDMVIGSGLPRDYFDSQLKTLGAMKIPVIEWAAPEKIGDGVTWTMTDFPMYTLSGQMISEFIAADGALKSNAVIYVVPQYTMSVVVSKAIQSYLPKICRTCTVDYKEAATSDIGALGQKVTAYLQAHPKTNYVFCAFGDLCQGVGRSLKDAGYNKVKIITADPATTNYQNIHDGVEYATRPLPTGQTGWQIIDAAQRIFNGELNKNSLGKTRVAPMQIVTKIPDPKSPLIGSVPTYKQQYLKLWLQTK
jgi:ABC-type sugar transport system substrate-binding protein